MSPAFALLIESVVALLLIITIGYCYVLNKRLTSLKSDGQMLKDIIAELGAATAAAERAISGLNLTVQETDDGLGRRLKAAEAVSTNLNRQITVGEQVMSKVAQIAGFAQVPEQAPAVRADAADAAKAAAKPVAVVAPVAAQPGPEPAPRRPPAHDARAIAAAAQAFASRARMRARGAAA